MPEVLSSLRGPRGIANEHRPGDNGLIAWFMDPRLVNAGVAMTAQTLYLQKLHIREDETISKLMVYISTASTSQNANNFLLLYSKSGTLLGRSADQSTAFRSLGLKEATLTAEAGQSLSIVGDEDQYVWAGIHSITQGTTPAQAMRGHGFTALTNAGIAAAPYAAGMFTGLASVQTSFTPGSMIINWGYWIAAA